MFCLGSSASLVGLTELHRFQPIRCFGVMSRMLVLCLLMVPSTPTVAEQDAKEAVSGHNDPCPAVELADSGHQGSDSMPSTESCNPAEGEMSVEARQSIAAEITEGMQTAGSLKSLLFGRNYFIFGRAEIEAATSAYAVYFEFEEKEGASEPTGEILHTSNTFLIGPEGDPRAIFRHSTSPEEMASVIRTRLAQAPDAIPASASSLR